MTDAGATWPGGTDRESHHPSFVAAVDRLADAAVAGHWSSVLDQLDADGSLHPNLCRLGGRSWYTPLHQAAWHGAEVGVVLDLLDRGAWRSLREADGQQALDVARARGHTHLLDVLRVDELDEAQRARYRAWDGHLQDLVERRTSHLPRTGLRHVSTEVVAQEGLRPLWFAVPGMYGGFSVQVFGGRLFVESWSRVVGGSGQAHVITERGSVLVDEGFV